MKLLIKLILVIWLLTMLASCHDPINPVQRCGRVSYITETHYEISIPYVEKGYSDLRLRFITNRPDTIVFNSIICLR